MTPTLLKNVTYSCGRMDQESQSSLSQKRAKETYYSPLLGQCRLAPLAPLEIWMEGSVPFMSFTSEFG
jgi:hypothetical protein